MAKRRAASSSGQTNQVRVIGGRWRGRRLMFPSLDGLRPTPDRLRETLFNWLAPELHGARCLDLFAGSGVLGIEAVSRGAQSAVLVDNQSAVVQQLRATVDSVGGDSISIIMASGLDWLARWSPESPPFDLVFVDPPYHCGLVADSVGVIERVGCLAPGAWIYIETGTDEMLPPLPPHWRLHREKSAGQVASYLFQRD